MTTKPNQPKHPSDWIDYGSKLRKLATKALEQGKVSKKNVASLNKLLKELSSLKERQRRQLCLMSAKKIISRVEIGDATDEEKLIFALNELGINQFGALWIRFGKQIADAKHVDKFYPIKVKRDQRQSFEDACLARLRSEEKSLRDSYRYSYSKELDVEGMKVWLNSCGDERSGKEKHKYDEEMMFILELALFSN